MKKLGNQSFVYVLFEKRILFVEGLDHKVLYAGEKPLLNFLKKNKPLYLITQRAPSPCVWNVYDANRRQFVPQTERIFDVKTPFP